MNKSSEVFKVIETLINDSNNMLSVEALCHIAGVSRSGYYAWLKAASTREQREQKDREDFELILAAYRKKGYSKGCRGIHMTLLHMNPPVVMNIKKIRRLMDKYNLFCPIRKANPYRRMAKAMKTNHVADNLVKREFECYGPRTILLTDITYLPYDGKFAYLSTILDAYTKQILAYRVSDSLTTEFVEATIKDLVEKHGNTLLEATVVHSDQGCHYTSYNVINLLKDKKLRQSMSRKGNCWDNAPQESFFGHMKDHIKESLACCKTLSEVQEIIDNYIDYYNNDRYQWELAKLSPNEFYEFYLTGEYPLNISNKPQAPIPSKEIMELGKLAQTDKEQSLDTTKSNGSTESVETIQDTK